MFNPYSIRPIGSKKFEDHVLDIMTSQYYYNEPYNKCDEDLIKLASSGSNIWKSSPSYDPFEQLAIAVTVQAVIDYIHNYKKWKEAVYNCDYKLETLYHSYMLDSENNFFRCYSATELVFDKLLKELQSDEPNSLCKHRASYCIDKIMSNYSRYCNDNDILKVGGKKI